MTNNKTYVYRLMVSDLADLFADGKDHGNLMIADTLFGRGERVWDVTSYREGYQVTTKDMYGNLGNEFYAHDGEDWFVTDNPEYAALHLD
jgi:hypothetical protein